MAECVPGDEHPELGPDNHPFHAVAEQAIAQIEKGHRIWQKFTCANCGVRQTMEQANAFFLSGSCEECGFITNIEQAGCNYMMMVIGGRHA